MLQTTALVHEAYLGLIDGTRISWRNRAHFYAFAAGMIRNILIDAFRRGAGQKRGGNISIISLDEGVAVSRNENVDLLSGPDKSKVEGARDYAIMLEAIPKLIDK
jgi:DNA-directed RNA polymerase specialized sigma24 family protein